jgi:hypothetical protein
MIELELLAKRAERATKANSLSPAALYDLINITLERDIYAETVKALGYDPDSPSE